METLNSIHHVTLTLPSSSSSSSSSSGSNFHDRASFFARNNHHRVSIRVSSNSLARISTRKKINPMRGVFSVRCSSNNQSSGNSFSYYWRNLIFGILIAISFSLAPIRWGGLQQKNKRWGGLLAIKNKIEKVLKRAETVAEVVEEVAEEVAEVADEVVDHLPEGSNLKHVADIIENEAKGTAKTAHIADHFIEKIEDVEKEVESELSGKMHEKTNTEDTQHEIIKNNNNDKDDEQEITNKQEFVPTETTNVHQTAMEEISRKDEKDDQQETMKKREFVSTETIVVHQTTTQA